MKMNPNEKTLLNTNFIENFHQDLDADLKWRKGNSIPASLVRKMASNTVIALESLTHGVKSLKSSSDPSNIQNVKIKYQICIKPLRKQRKLSWQTT